MEQPTVKEEKPLYNDLKRGYELRSQLSEITDGLQIYEEISIIFLLCDTPKAGLGMMEAVLNEPDVVLRKNLFYKWLKNQSMFTGENWRDKLGEVLTIIQNYRLARVVGFTKKEQLLKRFKPKNNFNSFWVPGIRKVLYNLCDELPLDDCRLLIFNIEGQQDSFNSVKSRYLEYKLLSWSESGIINLGNDKPVDLEILIRQLKCFNLKNFIHDIEIIAEKSNCLMVRKKYNFQLDSVVSEYYKIIDPQKPGLCVIINEKNFTSSLLPKRWGTDRDAERLIEVFTAFCFEIKLHSDLSYKQLISTLQFYAETVNKTSSLFVLIILSHGSENVIFTSDSLPIDMNTIEMIFQAENCPKLTGKPKIFIVQSCQGQKWQKVISDLEPGVESDNFVPTPSTPSESLGPQKGDSMIAWSTVQGFASFRDKYNGSWYIQELCSELWKFGDSFDLVEIFTKVNNNLRSKVYGSQFMVPSLLLSLRAKVQFPYLKGNFSSGKKSMFERLIFEKLFKNFLNSRGTQILEVSSRNNK